MDRDPAESGDMMRLAAVTDILIEVAERINGDIADEAILAELHELRDRAHAALRRLSEQA